MASAAISAEAVGSLPMSSSFEQSMSMAELEETDVPSPLSSVTPSPPTASLTLLTNQSGLYRASSRAPQTGVSFSLDRSHPASPSSSQSTSHLATDGGLQQPQQQSIAVEDGSAGSQSAFPFRPLRSKVAPIFLPRRSDAKATDAASSTDAARHTRTASAIRLAGEEISVHSLTSSPHSRKGRSRLPPLPAQPTASLVTQQAPQSQPAERRGHGRQLSLTSTAASLVTASSVLTAPTVLGAQPDTEQPADGTKQRTDDAKITIAAQLVSGPSTTHSAAAVSLSANLRHSVSSSPAVVSSPSTASTATVSSSACAPAPSSSHAPLSTPLSASTGFTASEVGSPSGLQAGAVVQSLTAKKPAVRQPPADDGSASSCGCFAALMTAFRSTARHADSSSTVHREVASSRRKAKAVVDRAGEAAGRGPPPRQRVWSDHPKYAFELTPPPLMLHRPPAALPRCQSVPALLPSAIVQPSDQDQLKQLRLAIRRSFSQALSSKQQHAQMPESWRRHWAQNSSRRDSGNMSDRASARASTTADLLRRMPTALRLHMQQGMNNSAHDSPLCTDRSVV